MKLSIPNFFIAVSLQLAAIGFCSAQSNKNVIATLQAPPRNIAIDGDVKEWGDSLRYYNTEKRINYSISNTKDTLYMAIRVNDRSEQMRILHAGITFTIDPKGKKKDTYSITFPLNVSGSVSAPEPKKDEMPPGEVTQEDREELMRQRITNLRGIKVVGFKDIETDMITTSNTYGFQTAVNYDNNGYLICEAAIPMSFFHAEGMDKNEWAFNIKINGIQHKQKPDGEPGEGGGGSGMGGHGGGMGGGGGRGGRGGGGHKSEALGGDAPSELSKSEDFWEKFYLAK